MDFAEWPIEDKALFAALNPLAAQRLVAEEALTLSIAAVMGTSFAAAVGIINVLCAEFSISPEALRFKLARGDEDVWEPTERLKAMWASDGGK